MACPLLDDAVDEEVLILRRAFRHERVFRERADPLESLASLYRASYRASSSAVVKSWDGGPPPYQIYYLFFIAKISTDD